MRRFLGTVGSDVAATALISLLDAGADAVTGLEFAVGRGGGLTTAPTFRVWMLDTLGALDPAAAGHYAERIYERRESADEWAVALRNDWRTAGTTGRLPAVRTRTLELLGESAWSKRPSPGFLEAFDLAAATLAWEAVPRLEQWVGADDAALRHAAWIALDRLALEAPADFLPVLAGQPEWLSSQPLLRAGLFARGDLGAEREQAAVRTYLQRADLAQEEGRKFFDLVPNGNATVAHTLATTPRSPGLAELARRDVTALAVIRGWRTRPEWARWSAELAAAETRLDGLVASARRGGFSLP